jgi:hypothetical protein
MSDIQSLSGAYDGAHSILHIHRIRAELHNSCLADMPERQARALSLVHKSHASHIRQREGGFAITAAANHNIEKLTTSPNNLLVT